MEKYFKKQRLSTPNTDLENLTSYSSEAPSKTNMEDLPSTSKTNLKDLPSASKINLEDLPSDPADRKRISEYQHNERDEVRRKYLTKGPCQPRGHDFPKTLYKTDKAFCLVCYLFRDYTENKSGSDEFVTKGFDTWKNPKRLGNHVGLVAYFVHCFAHQLQLVVVAVAKNILNDFFDKISILLNVVGASCKRQDMIREDQRKIIEEGVIDLFTSIIKVLEYVEREGSDGIKRCQANGLLKYFHTFDFVFYLQLMLLLLGLTNNLSMALQNKDQDILNAMSLVKSTKQQLCKLRDNGWGSVIEKEFNDRFDEVNTELLGCTASLRPIDSFYQFDQPKLVRLSEFYPEDFSSMERISLEHQLGIYIDNISEDPRFANLEGLGDLARVMVETKKHLSHPLVYRLLKLVLTLHVATATVERSFSAMKIVKTTLRNRMSDEFLNDCMICYIEKDHFDKVTNDLVIKRFQSMGERRMTL
ncbi:LOW QUALITY PROTEIN: hypothetical protein N665_0035s0009 [Sinapis alba]|nr:LOW QUALITY PROTEIN: hypothetical protein N665_0035s0009 [Sinapis alba]